MTWLRRFPPLWRRLDVTVRDLPLALVLMGASLVPSQHGYGTEFGGVADRPFDTLGLLAAALQCLPLAGRRRWPALVLALVACGFVLDQLSGYHLVAGTALPIALLSAGAHQARHRRTTVLVGSAAFVALAVTVDRVATGEPLGEYLMFYAALALTWGIGAWLRATRATEAERRRLVAEATRTAERTRIARELHDVVTHHVTAMVVQTEAARYLTADAERLDATLTAVTDTGRRAITDMRHLLDVLNPDHATPVPGPDEALLSVVEQIRRAGQPVEFTEEGTPAASRGSADLVAHRVVQEALTNALKYAHGSPTTVRVRHRPEEITVNVSTDRAGPSDAAPGGGGRGLIGLRERVEVLGGDFAAGPDEGGGFTVHARIPARAPVGGSA
ncbi:signal transduction histidine kinase [Nocardiopsis sp. Huas11]|uniref:sensor histidine kinase n=1 Tax=Nocardiopsis sp. Huas11 TaxID=2183912 RepID=UPI000EAF8F34|nr:histidine kinase [Nocardiopsis sp. Huas11]RKS09329.1 signal transduction histidine kinase [Nocardiopsis sp. Huas11]